MLRRFTRFVGIVAIMTVGFALVSQHALSQTAAKPGEMHININTAGVPELAKLPHIGEKIAQKIVDYRSKNGPFRSPEDLMKIAGIGEKTYAHLKPLITIGSQPAPSAK